MTNVPASVASAQSSLQRIRGFGFLINFVALATLCGYALAQALYSGQQMNFALVGLLLLALNGGLWLWQRASLGARILLAISGVAQISLLVAMNNGNAMQIDTHMYYFAWLAILVLMIDWRVILAGAAVTAVHHIGLNFLMPQFIFPNGASFLRVVVHALAVVAETGALLWFTLALEKMLKELQVFGEVFAEATATLNLTLRLNEASGTEVGVMARSANGLIGKLREAMQDVRRSSEALDAASTQLDASNGSVLKRSHSQVEAADAIAMTMDDSAQEIANVSQMAHSANQQSEILRKEAERLLVIMQTLENNSEEISKTSEFITEISEQTNLLALNASIEAARAGDAGRGFAVVADEVRTLAGNANESASSISQRVMELKKSISTAGEAIGQMTGKIADMNEISQKVNQAIQGQAAAIEEVSSTARNFKAQLAEVVTELGHSAASASKVSSESQSLREKTGQFRV